MENTIEKSVEYLKLKKPWDIQLKWKIKCGNAADYLPIYKKSGKLKNHRIRINCSNLPFDRRSIDCLIAHEFIHAWQEETQVIDAIHGKHFQLRAMFLEEYLKSQGIITGRLFLPGIDQ